MVLGLFTIGLLGGGVLSAMLLWLASGLAAPVPLPVRLWMVVAVAALAVLADAGVLRLRLPQNRRQIPREVLRDNLAAGSLRFGFELGTGVRTYLSASAPYALAFALLLASPGAVDAVLAGLGFGAGRAATPLTRYASGAGEAWDARLHAALPVLTTGASVALGLAFAWLVLP